MSQDDRKNVKLSEESHRDLVRIQGYLQVKTGDNASMDDAVSVACDAFFTLNDNDVPKRDWE